MSSGEAIPGQPELECFKYAPHPYLVLKADAAFTIVAVNARYLEATGTRRADILGRGMFEAFPDNPENRHYSSVRDLRLSFERVLRDRTPDIMGVQHYDIRNPAGGFEVRYWSPVNTPIPGPDGSPAFILHHVEDVTEFILAGKGTAEKLDPAPGARQRAGRMEAEVRRRAAELKAANRRLKATMEELEHREAELSRLNRRLQEFDQAKSEFFANVSHEFRTPLTLLLGPLDEILAGFDPGAPAASLRPRLELAHRNALRLTRLVNNLLDFSRLEAGHGDGQAEPTDLAALTADLASNFSSACAQAGLRLSIDCPATGQMVFIDRGMWEKILLNLLSNAFKFTLEGEIEVALRLTPDAAVLTVRDTGTGIPAGELPCIFQRFHRVAGARGRSHEGSGIGLALVHELVRRQGGSVAVDSKLGHGSSFTVSLPLAAEGEGASVPAGGREAADGARPYVAEALRWLPAPAGNGAAAGIGPTVGAPRILVADDNADMRDYVSRLLTDAGFAVTTVGDGRAALAACRAEAPDAVVCDVMMPDMDGISLVRCLRADVDLAGIPLLLLSARAGDQERIEGLEAGADDYIVKPFGSRELVARVEGAVRLARQRHQSARDLRHSNDSLQALAGRLERVQEDERTRLSREIHDKLGQILTGLKIDAAWLRQSLQPDQAPLAERIAHMMQLLDGATQTVREVSWDLRPGILDVGLEAAIEAEMPEYQRRLGIRCKAHLPEEELTLDKDAATELFRIFQELMTNVARHANASRVDVRLELRQEEVVLTVQDNGVGMEVPPGQASLGLLGVRERAARFGGRMEIRSIPRIRGTMVMVSIPMERALATGKEAT